MKIITLMIITLILLLQAAVFAQGADVLELLMGGKAGFWTYDILTDTAINITHEAALILGENDKTKSNKIDTTATKRSINDFMVWWSDSTEQITNGTFDSDMGIFVNNDLDTCEWVVSGGGFTGAIHVQSTTASSVSNPFDVQNYGIKYNFQCDINVISLTSPNRIRAGVFSNGGDSFRYFDILTVGLHHIDTSFIVPNNGYIQIYFIKAGTGYSAEFYVDNVSLTNIVDSSSGLSKQLTNLTPETEYSYYHSAFVYTAAGDKSIDYYQGVTKTFTTDAAPASENYMVTADGDTMYTSEGDTMKTSFIQFDILEQLKNGENNEEDFILPQRVYAYLNSKRTMELNS